MAKKKAEAAEPEAPAVEEKAAEPEALAVYVNEKGRPTIHVLSRATELFDAAKRKAFKRREENKARLVKAGESDFDALQKRALGQTE